MPALAQDGAKRKVFVLAGQSNMEGKAQNSLLEYQATAPKTSPATGPATRIATAAVRISLDIMKLSCARAGPVRSAGLAWYNAPIRDYVSYTTRAQTSPITGDTAVQASSENGLVMRGCSATRAIFMSNAKSTFAALAMPEIGAALR